MTPLVETTPPNRDTGCKNTKLTTKRGAKIQHPFVIPHKVLANFVADALERPLANECKEVSCSEQIVYKLSLIVKISIYEQTVIQ